MPQAFNPNTQKTINLGLSDSTYWIKFKVKKMVSNNPYMEWAVTIRNVSLEQVFIFMEKENKKIIGTGNLNSGAYINPHVKYRFPTAKFRLNYSEEVTFYIKLHTESEANYPIVIMPYDELIYLSGVENIVFGVNIGIFIALVFPLLILFIAIRDNIFLYLIFHMISIILVEETLMGFVQFFASVNSLSVPSNIFLISVGISHTAIILFTINFFKLKVFSPTHTIFVILILLNIFPSIISYFSNIMGIQSMPIPADFYGFRNYFYINKKYK